MFVVRMLPWGSVISGSDAPAECIVYTWDYHSSISFWSGLRVQPILSDEVQTFKALIMVHKVLQEGHPVVRNKSLYAADQILTYSSEDDQRGTKSNRVAGNVLTNYWP